MRLHSLKYPYLGCYQCGHIWKWQYPPKKPKQCPNCLSRRWDKRQNLEKQDPITIAGQDISITVAKTIAKIIFLI